MELQLQGKRALITGSTAGIGYAIAAALAAEGAAVVVNGRGRERIDKAAERIKAAFPQADVDGVAADLGTAEGAIRVLGAVPDVDILVNNLSIFEPKAFVDIDDRDWQRFLETNLMSGVRLARHYLPGMKARNWGRIVFISSESAIQIPAEMIQYGVTKTAQLALARGLAETTVDTGVTVNSILPGPTRSESMSEFFAWVADEQNTDLATVEHEFFQQARPSSLLNRLIEPTEIAPMVALVCSPLAAAVNGAALRVDGGVVRAVA
jgi:NAD(P)-dependent dehydrogenase (short-subunit alcohol dehydrogenase family)